jgi:site-specific DNA-methyltransferase (adenine-specific)
MAAFALRADGWYLRSDIIWHKPNPMPESVTDRPTKAHEYIFLLSKSQKYFYDAEAIREQGCEASVDRLDRADLRLKLNYNEAHFVNPPIRARLGKEGVNSRMHVSRDPAHEREYNGKHRSEEDNASGRRILKGAAEARANGAPHDAPFGLTRNKRSVWTVTTSNVREAHFATFPPDLIKPCILAGSKPGDVILDPFFGSGTTGMVALELGRSCIGIELNPVYAEMARRRVEDDAGMFAQVAAE